MKKIVPQSCAIVSNRCLDRVGQYFKLTVAGFASPVKIKPGQFVHVKVAEALDPYFRRAFSVADYDQKKRQMDIVYKVIGRGTTHLASLHKNDRLDLIGPLGNGFGRVPKSKTVLIAAGGVGLPPLYFLAKHLVEKNHDPERILFFYGGRKRQDLISLSDIRKLGVNLMPCTDDGSYGFSGLITEALISHLPGFKKSNIMVFGCGPEPMLQALQSLALEHRLDGELSLEAPMPCGVGVCLGCIRPSLKNNGKYVRVCCEGPVFKIGEVEI
jgi:dihydroorotate dehydrogenase electron transfer subunit